MKINKKGIGLIKEFEGLATKAYLDPVGIPTIGYGHISTVTKTDVKEGKTVTKEDAEKLLQSDLERFEKGVGMYVKVPLNSNQFSALVSFSYNVGLGNLFHSTLLKKLNAGDYQGASKEFGRWIKAGGMALPGLVRRREAERMLFVTPEKEE